MSGVARKLTREQEKQRRRTQNGLCSRCGRRVGAHSDAGRCPDGGGSYTWAMTSEDARALEKGLSDAIATAGSVTLTAVEQRVLDYFLEQALKGSGACRTSEVAQALSMPRFYVEDVIKSLVSKGMLGRNPGDLS